MIEKINSELVSIIMKGNLPVQDPEQVRQIEQRRQLDMSRFNTSRTEQGQQGQPGRPEEKKVQPIRVEKKVGRNDPCPCGSGKKFKNCHGINLPE